MKKFVGPSWVGRASRVGGAGWASWAGWAGWAVDVTGSSTATPKALARFQNSCRVDRPPSRSRTDNSAITMSETLELVESAISAACTPKEAGAFELATIAMCPTKFGAWI